MVGTMTYAEAGVDIAGEVKSISALINKVKYSRRGIGAPLDVIGHYAGLIDFGEYALALCTDGVGTKVMIADEMQKWDTVGIDCVAMNVNDCICVGAEPLAFVDYLALKEPNPKLSEQIGIGLNRGAEISNISIVGGETALLPDLINGFDLAGTCLGYVKKEEIITGKEIQSGDVVIGLKSSGIHSNGLTLARKVFKKYDFSFGDKFNKKTFEEKGFKFKNLKFPRTNLTIGEVLLEPTRIYVKPILELLKKFNADGERTIHGLAHITGSGIRKMVRLNKQVDFWINNPIKPQEIFDVIKRVGAISDEEMYRTFNMGMGFCIIADRNHNEDILEFLEVNEIESQEVGEVKEGSGNLIFKLSRDAIPIILT